MKSIRYAVIQGTTKREFSAKSEALSHARALVRDGWPTSVRDERTNEIIWEDEATIERLRNGR